MSDQTPEDAQRVHGTPETRAEDRTELTEKGYYLKDDSLPVGITLEPGEVPTPPPAPPAPTNDAGGAPTEPESSDGR